MARAPAALLLALLGMSLLAAPAHACATSLAADVPCGYIYPRLVFDLGARGTAFELRGGHELALSGTLTFTWDVSAEGLAANDPLSPIVVSFAFPGIADGLQASVEPANITVPIDPSHAESHPTPTGVQLVYNFTAPITLHARLNGTPVLAPGEPPRLLIVAASSESGFYKPGFGVRDLPLSLPEARVQQQGPARSAALRVADPQPLALGTVRQSFQGADFALTTSAPIEVWAPARLTASVQHAGAAVTDLDLAASVVDERNEVLYTTGLLHRSDGALPFAYTFPAPGNYRVLLAARPLATVTSYLFEPVVADFPVTLLPLDADAMRMPAKYRAAYDEPTAELHANTQDIPRQYEKLYRFPVADGASAVSAQVTLGTTLGTASAGSIYGELLGAGGEQLGYGKVDALTPQLDLQLKDGLTPGEYRLHLYGSGASPLGVAGTMLHSVIAAFYDRAPLLPVQATGTPESRNGDPIALGTGGVEAQVVLDQAPAVWRPVEGVLLVKDARGQVALHPDFIFSVSSPDGTVLSTTGHRHPHDGLLPVSFTPDAPGTYIVSAFSGPTPEASGAFWEPAIASWPFTVPAPADGLLPAMWHAHYHESTSSLRVSTQQGYAYLKDFAVPVLPGASDLEARLDLGTMAVVQHVDGVGPAALTMSLLPPGAANGSYAASPVPQAVAAGGASLAEHAPHEGTWTLRVQGAGYAPLDYAGALYNLTLQVHYPQAPRLAAEGPPPLPPPRATPGFEGASLLAVAAALAMSRRR
ncbi:MAG: hypothetical protein LC624_03725 [Halobacteriales archaeon]|nr:hypothetical protein [Halobacteriales archaeon]